MRPAYNLLETGCKVAMDVMKRSRHNAHGLGCLLILCLTFFSNIYAPAGPRSLGDQEPDAKANQPAKDSFGDPLPEGVFYRMGTVRLRHQNIQTLIFSLDGSQLLSQGTTPDLRIWDVATGKIFQQVAIPEAGSHLIASPDDRYLACVVNRSPPQVVLMDKAGGKELARWDHRLSWLSLAFSKDGKELVGLTREETVVKWNIASRKEISRTRLDMTNVAGNNPSQHWSLSPDGSLVAFKPFATAGEPALPWRFWDTATAKECRRPVMTQEPFLPARWSPDGRFLAVVGSDNTLEVWDTVTGKRLALAPPQPLDKGNVGKLVASGATFHHDGKLLALANNDTVAMWDLEKGKRLWEKELAGDVLAFSPDGRILAIGGVGGISVVKTATGEPVGGSKLDPGPFNPVRFMNSDPFFRGGRSFLIYGRAGFSEIETATGKRLRSFDFAKGRGFSYGGLFPDINLMACIGNDEHQTAQFFAIDPLTGKERWRRPGQPSETYFAADGKTMALLSWKNDVFSLLDLATGRDIKKLSIPSYNNEAHVFKAVSDDLHLAATTQNWQKIDLWDLDTGKKIRSLECPPVWGHGTLYFTPGSRLLVGAGVLRYVDEKEKRERTRV